MAVGMEVVRSMNITDMTRKDFERLPWRESWSGEGICDSIVILPAQIPRWRFWWHRLRVSVARALRLHEPEEWESIPGLHDSCFRCMDYVAVVKNEAVCRLSGCSDVLHIEGIGGHGYKWLQRFGKVPNFIHVAGCGRLTVCLKADYCGCGLIANLSIQTPLHPLRYILCHLVEKI